MSIQVTTQADQLAEVTSAVAGAQGKEAKEQFEPVAQEAAEQTKESSAADTEETEAKLESKDEESEPEADAETEEAEDKETDHEDKPKKKSGAQRRKERAERAEAEAARARAEAEHWRTMALRNADDAKADKPAEKTASTQAAGEPDPDDFDTHAAYVKAVARWEADQAFKEREQKAEKSKLEQEHKSLINSHVERVKSFKEKTADFDDVLEAVDDIPVSPTIQEIIISSENGPELMYELARNREEYARICKLPPLAAAREMGRLDARLSKSSEEHKPELKKTTQAPKPIAPVGSKGGKVEKSIYDPNLSQKEYEDIRAKQMRSATA